jgi:hypothetical protein
MKKLGKNSRKTEVDGTAMMKWKTRSGLAIEMRFELQRKF